MNGGASLAGLLFLLCFLQEEGQGGGSLLGPRGPNSEL